MREQRFSDGDCFLGVFGRCPHFFPYSAPLLFNAPLLACLHCSSHPPRWTFTCCHAGLGVSPRVTSSLRHSFHTGRFPLPQPHRHCSLAPTPIPLRCLQAVLRLPHRWARHCSGSQPQQTL